jgi:hypothetical protein
MHRDIEHTLALVETEAGELDAVQLGWHPPDKWSAAQILEHLSRTYSATAYILNRCCDQGRSKARSRTLRDRLGTLVVVELGRFPTGVAAPAATRPAGLPALEALAAVRGSLGALDQAAARAEARFGTRLALANHPLLGPFNVRQWRRFHLVHTKHHMKQIGRLRARMP